MVLDKFGSGLKNAFKKITRAGIVDKKVVEEVVKDLQRALLSADVDVELVAKLSEKIKKGVLKAKLPAGLTLREYFIKILYDEIVNFLGTGKAGLELKKQKILLIGLFGSGKTTTIGKLAKWFKTRGLRPAAVGCDIYRPAAQEQLKQIVDKINVPVYLDGKGPSDIAKKALKKSKEDVLIFDSAGRDALDKKLAKELKDLAKIIKPDEVLLVIPADIGQVAKKQAEEFNKLVGITGIIITKLDGTAKAGGALAAASASNTKVKFIGVGEKIADLELYDPQRFVSKLIGHGDIQGLLEKAKEAGIDERGMKKIMEGRFTLNEFCEQIKSMQKMGSLSKIADMVPGFGKMKIPKGLLDVQEEKMKKWQHAIDSMTKEEKENPDIIKAPRVKRIAKGAGVSESSVRELLKYFKQTKKIMKMTKGGAGLKRGALAKIARQFGLKV